MHNKETYTHVYTRVCAHIDIRVYAKYARIIRVCVVRIVPSCTVSLFCVAYHIKMILNLQFL